MSIDQWENTQDVKDFVKKFWLTDIDDKEAEECLSDTSIYDNSTFRKSYAAQYNRFNERRLRKNI